MTKRFFPGAWLRKLYHSQWEEGAERGSPFGGAEAAAGTRQEAVPGMQSQNWLPGSEKAVFARDGECNCVSLPLPLRKGKFGVPPNFAPGATPPPQPPLRYTTASIFTYLLPMYLEIIAEDN